MIGELARRQNVALELIQHYCRVIPGLVPLIVKDQDLGVPSLFVEMMYRGRKAAFSIAYSACDDFKVCFRSTIKDALTKLIEQNIDDLLNDG